MDIIVIAFLLFGLFILIVILAGLVRIQNNSAKKEAKKILAEGIRNPKKLKWAMGVLNKMSKDLEAADLWKRLNELSQKE